MLVGPMTGNHARVPQMMNSTREWAFSSAHRARHSTPHTSSRAAQSLVQRNTCGTQRASPSILPSPLPALLPRSHAPKSFTFTGIHGAACKSHKQTSSRSSWDQLTLIPGSQSGRSTADERDVDRTEIATIERRCAVRIQEKELSSKQPPTMRPGDQWTMLPVV